MTHDYFDLETDLIRPLKEFLKTFEGEAPKVSIEQRIREFIKPEIQVSHNLEIVRLLKNRQK